VERKGYRQPVNSISLNLDNPGVNLLALGDASGTMQVSSEDVVHTQRVMSRDRFQHQQKLNSGDLLDRTLLRHGLADLVPRSRRGNAPLPLKLVFLSLALIGLLGLPYGGVLLCLVLAFAVEAANLSRRQRESWLTALGRPSFWERIRSPFYWTLAVSVGLVALFLSGETLLASLLRGGFQWLCFRAIEDLITHPERYRSIDDLVDWLDRLKQQVDRTWSAWLSFATLAIAAAFLLNLVAPAIWLSVGNAEWARLLIFGGGLYLIAILVFHRSSRSTVRATVEEGAQNLAPKVVDLAEALYSAIPMSDAGYTDFVEQIEARLRWKRADKLVARVRSKLESTLVRRLRWGALLGSLSILLLAFSFLTLAAFLIVPRDVMTNWISGGQTEELGIALAFDNFAEFTDPEFVDRILGMNWPDIGREPLLKIAFLEAALLVSLVLFRSASDRAELRSMANAASEQVQQGLLLGTAYLTLVEKEFQHLYSGFVSRQVTDVQTSKTVTMRNEVLLAPSVATKADVYRSVSDYVRLHGVPGWRTAPYLVALFTSYRMAEAWTLTFIHPPTHAPQQEAALKQEPVAGRFWVWSGEQLLDLASLEEAQWYGRFAAR
jgi:hypothetical protein